MNLRTLCATTLTGLGYLGIVLSAQQTTTAGPKRAVSKPPAEITLKGCVAEASGHFLLNRATIVAPPEAPPTAPAAASTRAATNSDDHVYELIGAAIRPHIGHEVEVVGKNVAGETAATPGGADPNDLKRAAHPMTGTVTVTSVKMLSSTCPT